MKLTPEERRAKLISNETIYKKVQQLAENLTKLFASNMKILTHIKMGDNFCDVESGKQYMLCAAMLPFAHTDIITLVTETAKQPLETFTDALYYSIRENFGIRPSIILPDNSDGDPNDPERSPTYGQNFLISARDFIKYFAVGQWVLIETPKIIDPDDFAEQKDVLNFTG